MDAIELLTQQHREVEQLFERFEEAGEQERQEIARTTIVELRLHTAIEEEIFPRSRSSPSSASSAGRCRSGTRS